MTEDFITRYRLFDWDAAAWLIRQQKLTEAWAGVLEDWESTRGLILTKGKPVLGPGCKARLSSHWGILVISGDVEMERHSHCWVWEDVAGWSKGDVWPATALAILKTD